MNKLFITLMSVLFLTSSLHARFGRSIVDGMGIGIGASLTNNLFAPRPQPVILEKRIVNYDDEDEIRPSKKRRQQMREIKEENESLRDDNHDLKKKHAELLERLENLEKRVK